MLFFTFLSPVADRFISSSRLSLRWWSQSLFFERKHQSSKQWPERPRSRSPLEVVSIYLASFRCKLHCACRITRTTTFLSSALDVSLANVVLAGNSKSQAPTLIIRHVERSERPNPMDGDGAAPAPLLHVPTRHARRSSNRELRLRSW